VTSHTLIFLPGRPHRWGAPREAPPFILHYPFGIRIPRHRPPPTFACTISVWAYCHSVIFLPTHGARRFQVGIGFLCCPRIRVSIGDHTPNEENRPAADLQSSALFWLSQEGGQTTIRAPITHFLHRFYRPGS
jgi:hypothetical protein